ncbi:MAG: VWA domain-containing protein, partial [Candidatus Omnitrophica bacterium]|nr:VWA domain-containing protein [Candidatus Omnitrophota bacterium]
KKFVEERELVVMIMVDVSRSSKFATEGVLKNQLAAEISSLLALSAIRNNDKVGLIVFTDKIEKFIPPRKGTKHVLRVIREVLYFKPENNKTNINHALDYLNKVTTRKTISFLISDYLTDEGQDSLKKSLSAANKRHDLIAITLNDPREQNLPDCGLITLEDAETGQTVVIDSSDKNIRKTFFKLNQERIVKRKELFRMCGVDFIDISTDMSYSDEIVKFFLKRRKRIRR